MGNLNNPGGLQIAKTLKSARWYKVASNYATAIFIGDPVIQSGTANQVTLATEGTGNKVAGAVLGVADSNMVPGIQLATGERVNYIPASTGGYVLVADDPTQEFIVQENGAGNAKYVANACGGNVNLASGSGATISGRSGWGLAAGDTPGNTAGDQIRLIRPVDMVDNTVGEVYCKWFCTINNHQRAAGIVGAGV